MGWIGCVSFDHDLSLWDVSNVENKTYMLYNCPMKDEYEPKFK